MTIGLVCFCLPLETYHLSRPSDLYQGKGNLVHKVEQSLNGRPMLI
jgi:hypothetical protein